MYSQQQPIRMKHVPGWTLAGRCRTVTRCPGMWQEPICSRRCGLHSPAVSQLSWVEKRNLQAAYETHPRHSLTVSDGQQSTTTQEFNYSLALLSRTCLSVSYRIWPVNNNRWGSGVVICLQRDTNDLHISADATATPLNWGWFTCLLPCIQLVKEKTVIVGC